MNAETPTNNDLSKSTTTTTQKDYNMEYIAETQNNDLSKLTNTNTQEINIMENAKDLANNDSSSLILGDNGSIIADTSLDSANLPPINKDQNKKDLIKYLQKANITEFWAKQGIDIFYKAWVHENNITLRKTYKGNDSLSRSWGIKEITNGYEYLLEETLTKDGGAFFGCGDGKSIFPLKEYQETSTQIITEIDDLTKNEQKEKYQWFSEITGLTPYLISSGGKSIHFHLLLDKQTPINKVVYLRRLLCLALKGDPAVTTASQPFRLPTFYRKEKGNYQEILQEGENYSYDQILEGLKTIFNELGYKFPDKIDDDYWKDLKSALKDKDNDISTTLEQGQEQKKAQYDKVVNNNPDKVKDLVLVLQGLGYDIPQNEYHYQALKNEYLIVSQTLDNRNTQLNTSAFNLGTLINEGLEEELIRSILIKATINSRYYTENRTEVINTIKSGIEAGKKQPRSDRPSETKEKDLLEVYKREIKDTRVIDTLKTGFDGILIFDDNFLNWYFYDDKVKCFDKRSENAMKSIIRERRIQISKSICHKLGIPEDHPEIDHNPSSKNVDELFESLRLMVLGEIDNSLHGYLPLANGMLDLKTKELKPHHPNFKNTYCLPHKYDPSAECPNFLNWLKNEALNNPDDILIIQAFFYATLTGMGVHKFLELIGRPRSGKGTLMRVLTTLMGNKNSANVELDYLENSRFIMPRIMDKRLIAISETEPNNKRKLIRFLALTGRDPQTIEEKGKPIADKDKTFQGLVLFASNYPIEGNDPAKALDTRRLTVHMDNVLNNEEERKPLCEEINGQIVGEFVPEMSGILNWALSIDPYQAKIILLNPSGHVKNYNRQAYEDELDKSDRLPQFLESVCIIDPNGTVRPTDLFTRFSQFCMDETGDRFSNTFKSERGLMAKIKPLLQKYRVEFTESRNNKGKIYKGFRLKNNNDPDYGLVSQAYKIAPTE